jgi:hypothetical protein
MMTAAFLFVMSPRLTRNYLVFGEARLTSFYGGYVFWLGNNCYNARAYRARSAAEFLRQQGDGWQEGIRMAASLTDPRFRDPTEQERYWVRHAWDDIQRCGGVSGWFELLALKAWHFLRPWPNVAAHSAWVFWPVAIGEVALYAAGLCGLFLLGATNRRVLVPLAILLATGTISHALTFETLRHRVPFVDLVMLVAAAVLGSCWLRRESPLARRRAT